mmetsp:Transcript_44/g.93  ORF Transcript_44/g.93 Transcript_44/m.93 type:complete len:144 (+) Transcript_44:85-516(+)
MLLYSYATQEFIFMLNPKYRHGLRSNHHLNSNDSTKHTKKSELLTIVHERLGEYDSFQSFNMISILFHLIWAMNTWPLLWPTRSLLVSHLATPQIELCPILALPSFDLLFYGIRQCIVHSNVSATIIYSHFIYERVSLTYSEV